MTLGIGLGGFVSGMEAGMNLGLGIRDANRNRRTENELKQITADANEKYGNVMSDEAYDYMMKRKYALHMKNGEVEKANQIRDWSRKETSRKGTKLFGSIGAALNSGDYEAAARLANELSGLDGYGPNGDYNFEYTQHPTEGPGFYVKSESGEVFVPQNNALPFLARHFNPDVAAQWHSEQSKSNKDLEKEAQQIRSNAIKALEKQYDGGLSGEEKKWRDMPTEEREPLIQQYALEQIAPGRRKKFQAYFGGEETGMGQGRKAAPGMIVDQTTGQPVKSPEARAEAPKEPGTKPGADGSIAKSDLPPLASNVTGVAGPTEGPGSTTSPLTRNREVINAVDAAETMLREGGDRNQAIKTLQDAKVPEGYWPRSLRGKASTPAPTGLGASPSAPVKKVREEEDAQPPA